MLKLAQDRKTAGVATGIDVTREQVQVENEKQRLLVAESDRERAKLNLIRTLGIPFDVRVTLTDDLTFVPMEQQSAEDALTVARENRVELRAQAQREKLASLTYRSTVSERLPSLAFNGDYGLIGVKPEDAQATRTVGVTLSVPIFDGGQREGRISESRSKLRQETIRTKDVSDQVTLEVRDALITLASARQQVSVAQEGLSRLVGEETVSRLDATKVVECPT
ncbi:MAG: hypothetical protein C4293_12215, partial [Nitrospiraceae bacterium]